MLLILGHAVPKMESFSVSLATKYLKKTVKVLNENTFQELLPEMDKTTPIVIEKGCNVGKHHQEFLTVIRKRNMVVLMEDCKEGDLHEYATVSPSGKYVVIKSSFNGFKQHVLVINDVVITTDCARVDKVVQKKEGQPPPPPDEGMQAQAIGTTIATVKSTEMLSQVAEFIMTDMQAGEEPTHYWEILTTVSIVDYAYTPQVQDQPWLSGSLVKAFGTLDIYIYATKTPRNKWIQFKLTDAIGMNSKMNNDDNWARGFFNNYAFFQVFPGYGTPDDSHLPQGWVRPYIEPHTPNSATKYTSTTGWGVEVTGGGDPDGPHAEVTAKYDQSKQVVRTINDFSVRNISDGSMTGWNFYYTAVDGNKWKDHFDFWNNVKGIADLAKSTLTLNAEAVYRGPPDMNEVLQWSVRFAPTFSLLRANYAKIWLYSNTLNDTNYTRFSIDMGNVKNPDK